MVQLKAQNARHLVVEVHYFGSVQEQYADRKFLQNVYPLATRLILHVIQLKYLVLDLLRIESKLECEHAEQ